MVMTLTAFGNGGNARTDVDVVVAGGGPVGLMLACELRLGGASVLVLERLTGIDETVKAGSLNVPAVEALYRRGLLPQVLEEQQRMREQFQAFARQRPAPPAHALPAHALPAHALPAHAPQDSQDSQAPEPPLPPPPQPPQPPPPRFAGHFAGLFLDAALVDGTDPDFADPGPAVSGAMITQQAVETLLGRRAVELGAEIRRGTELTGFESDDAGVTVTAGVDRIRASWLVGCDGGRSLVRRQAGFDFPGTGPEITGHQAVVEMTGSEGLRPGWNRTEGGVYVFGPAPGRILTVEFDGPPGDREAPVTAAELAASLRRVAGIDVTITAVHSATRYTDNARQAATYRLGRVLLAGDAAHVHSPFGGQGLNLGLGDAMNLGWKLAAVAGGRAPEHLLDSYTAERHPIGAWVLDWSRAQVALMRPEPGTRALSGVVRDLMGTVSGTTYFVKRISGLWQRYDLGHGHELAGRSAPDLPLADGTRLADHLHDGRGLLLDLADDPELRALAQGWAGQVQIVTAGGPGEPELSALLVRPDGYVAWAAGAGAGLAGLQTALTAWFGPPGAGPPGRTRPEEVSSASR
jgi:2-polyprenyl-6-methoxyphenol hydroxylase-like FAD-dependent oxidoreductase